MTGLQALERAASDKNARVGAVAGRLFEYTRHGTTTIIGNWDVVQGEMIAETIGPTHRTGLDRVHIEQTVATDSDVPWVFVMTASMRTLVGRPGRMGGKTLRAESAAGGMLGVLKSQATPPSSFRSKPSHSVRVPPQAQSPWLNQIEVIFGIVMRKVTANRDEEGHASRQFFTSVADLETKLRAFLTYFNQTLAHPFDWTYTGKPVAPRHRRKFCPPHRRRQPPTKVKLAKLSL